MFAIKNYTTYHLHSEFSLLDSCTKVKDYILYAKQLNQNAIGFTEHGNIYNWVEKKMLCDENDIKYIHGCEVYLTEKLVHIKTENKCTEYTIEETYKTRDNFHTVLLAKNYEGVKEINHLIGLSTQDDHFYYKPRITFDEFFNISDNVIKISACLASPLNRLKREYDLLEDKKSQRAKEIENIIQKLLLKYDYYEIQYHNTEEQIKYNKELYEYSKKYNKPLIVGTDTHSLTPYKAECRLILQKGKRNANFDDEGQYDLTYKTYDELVDLFKQQNSLDMEIVLQALENTNIMADSVENFELDTSFKYPKMYDNDDEVFVKRIYSMFEDKLKNGIIPLEQEEIFKKDIEEEIRVFRKIGMMGLDKIAHLYSDM